MTESEAGWKWAHAVVLAVGAILLGTIVVQYWTYTVDDTFISLRYAKHLAQGHGLVYNVGERVEGYTNFLWTVFLALPHVLRLDPVPVLKSVNVLLVLGTSFMTFRLARATTLRTHPGFATLAAALVLASPAMTISAVEGLETCLFTFLLVSAITLFLEEGEAPRFPWSALALVALAMTRPDGAIYGFVLPIVAMLSGRSRTYVVRMTGLFLALYGAYFFARFAYYGDWLPNTFYAKRGGDLPLIHRGVDYAREFFAQYGGFSLLLVPLAFLGSRARNRAALLLGIVALRLAFHVWSGGPYMGHHRFLVPVLPFLDVLVLLAVATLPAPTGVRGAIAVVAAAAAVAGAWWHEPVYRAQYQTYARGLAGAHITFGKAVHDHTAPGTLIAIDDAGAAPYYSDRANVDMLGLNDAHIAHLPGRFYEKFDVSYVLQRRPDLIVLLARRPDPRSPYDMLVPSHAVMINHPDFVARYSMVGRYEFAPVYHLLVFRRDDSTNVPAQ